MTHYKDVSSEAGNEELKIVPFLLISLQCFILPFHFFTMNTTNTNQPSVCVFTKMEELISPHSLIYDVSFIEEKSC